MNLKKKLRIYSLGILSALCLIPFQEIQSATTDFLRIAGEKVVDQQGRTVILNGLNHVNKNTKDKYLNPDDEKLFKQFKSWGFNCIRYGIIWDGLEPQPGVINMDYLNEIDKRVKWAEDNGIYLILDMHQDLYSQQFSDGAPEWATITDNAPHHTGDIWALSYFISPAVHNAFDNFWANTPAPDGVGIQDHYIRLWTVIAERYKNSPSVLGFDIMNEPFPGSQAEEVLGALLVSGSNLFTETSGMPIGEAEILGALATGEGRQQALELLSTRENYTKLLIGLEESVAKFERETLSPFYQKVRDAIRSVDPNQILILEHSYFSNLGVPSQIQLPVNESGNTDTQCLYAPHGYDLVTDTEFVAKPGTERVNVIFDAIFESGRKKHIPVVIGEWGAYYMGKNSYLEPARQIIEHIEKNLSGQTYWCYWNGIESQDYFPVLSRIYPMRTAGELLSYGNRFENNEFHIKWDNTQCDSLYQTILYIPDISRLTLPVNTAELTFELVKSENQRQGYLIIKPLTQNVHELNLSYN